jgi:hypothetical protein
LTLTAIVNLPPDATDGYYASKPTCSSKRSKDHSESHSLSYRKISRIWSGSAHFVSKATVASSRPKRGKRRVRHEYSLTHFAYNGTIQSILCSLWILEATAASIWSADRLERRPLPQRPSYGQAQTGSGSTDQV